MDAEVEALIAAGRLDAAVDLLLDRLADDATDLPAAADLAAAGRLALRRRRPATAVAAGELLTELDPGDTAAWHLLADGWELLGRRDEVIDVLRACLEHCPGDEHATGRLHRLLGEWAERAPVDTVRRLFDEYAVTFDAHLGELGYRAPELVAAAVATVLGDTVAPVVADLGCGTGLVGERIRSVASHVVGVDLSSGMLRVAAERGCYDELVEADLVEFLSGETGRFDLIVSADTLNYLGELRPTFAAAHRALVPGGQLVFTVERAAAGPHSYRLMDAGRFQHRADRVEQHLRLAGYEGIASSDVVLRHEGTREVAGLLFVARRPGVNGPSTR